MNCEAFCLKTYKRHYIAGKDSARLGELYCNNTTKHREMACSSDATGQSSCRRYSVSLVDVIGRGCKRTCSHVYWWGNVAIADYEVVFQRFHELNPDIMVEDPLGMV